MEFTKYKCPVCNEQFKSGDDVVVCPECGAPHHRDCYEELGHCFYEDKHSADFSFENIENENTEDEFDNTETVICPHCKTENEKTAFYCNKCGFPLNESNTNAQQQRQQQTQNTQIPFGQGTPFGYAGSGMPAFDPLAGLDSEQEIADGINVGEMAKFVGKSTQYFLLVFNRIKSFGSSRINFAAFLLNGIYFLYRKMYALGIIISAINIGLSIVDALVVLNPEYLQIIQQGAISTQEQTMLYYLPWVVQAIRMVIMFVCGFTANKLYYKHCTKKITEIKSHSTPENLNKSLENSGGVNLAFAISIGVAYLAVNYIATIIQMMSL